ncbi:DEKNAAC103149 [Brettanomyces naardenensis]|uniref:Proteasome assembly chaperone 2 n=1 Tax=Brettanomyces naardenensis TaxID=13370 RepID=A0A448YMK3_BRENA|nr:DEKNAAC103149 [Brettanomyces naardenensis]
MSASTSSLKGSTLILPIVSIGNIPQLTVDLLTYNLPDVRLVGRLDSTFLYPLASPSDYVEGDSDHSVNPVTTTTALEVYYCERYNLTLLQQRSPILPGCTRRFFTELIKPFIELFEFKRLVILQSNDQGLKEDRYSNNRLQIWTNDLAKNLELSLSLEDKTQLATVNECSEISPVGEFLLKKLDEAEVSKTTTSDLFLPLESGIATGLRELRIEQRRLYYEPAENIVLSIFAYEGDNSADAETLYRTVIKLLNVEEKGKVVTPKSWSGVYGQRVAPVGMEFGMYS